ncbi:Ubiquitin conjugation factor E4 A [Paragonimus heterotremus]|uniref:Ubiquitin conjugation factor E4 A n=1 Tax=Paragonimus heterotremus TaxID=100268 RepID=A0A8J4X1A2_9TREM|nr:Ubiquitin conjugation factor E4 A [Paragonimus heterotremus]
MSLKPNPFAELIKGADCICGFDSQSIRVTKVLENILLVSHDKTLTFGDDGRPLFMVFIKPSSDGQLLLTLDTLDQVIFDRSQLQNFSKDDLIIVSQPTATIPEELLISEPVNYIVSCFTRACNLNRQTQYPSIVEGCQDALVRQLLLFLRIDAALDSTQHCDAFYNLLYGALSGGDADQIMAMEHLFFKLIPLFEEDALEGIELSDPCPHSALKALRPLTDCLLNGLKNLQSDAEISLPNLFSSKPSLKPSDRLLFCPQREPFVRLALWYSRFPSTAELLLEASFPPNSESRQPHGFEYEAGLLGRLLVPSHLHVPRLPEATAFVQRGQQSSLGEFFTDEVPLKPMIEAEQRTIWQLTDQLDTGLHNIFLNLLRAGKQRPYIKATFFRWLGSSITANKARGQLAHTSGLLSDSDAGKLASDGFLNNLATSLVRLTGPLVNPTLDNPPVKKIWPSYAVDSRVTQSVLPGLCKETRLTAGVTVAAAPVTETVNYPVLTELFFLAHAAIRVGWTPLIARHFETAQQLHQLESQWEVYQANLLGAESNPQVQFLRRLIRERTSRYLEQSTSLSCLTRLRDQFAFSVTTAQLLVQLAHVTFNTKACSNECSFKGRMSDLPEFLVDNVVELISYLRRAKDDFFESTEVASIPLEPLLEFSILYMLHTQALSNPHLRARLAEVLESLIPQRDDEAWNSQRIAGTGILGVNSLSFLRRQNLMAPESHNLPETGALKYAVAALLTAFVSIELSPGTGAVGSAGTAADMLAASSFRGGGISGSEQSGQSTDGMINETVAPDRNTAVTQASDVQTATVGFEEKFQYRRPMYACLRYWYGNPLYDVQFHHLESEALAHIDDSTPPLFLQFLSLLVNDAIFLLDEAINLLIQLKRKEQEREAAGGRLASQEEESLFIHTGRLARHHIMLGIETIAALRRVVSVCPRLITHPILVDRVACMLNYFLARLVGPKQRDLTVRDKAAYGFRPDLLVIEICQIYHILALDHVNADQSTCSDSAEAFRRAVVSDERSFHPDLLDQAVAVLTRVSTAPIELCTKFSEAVVLIKNENVVKMEDELDVEDAPDDFVDPIMGHVMEDPVKLPASGHVVDRKTIYRHLLNDSTDPFTRQPLKMSQVVPQDELKATIRAWIAERRARLPKP